MSADLGREAVYAAEIAAFEGTSHEALRPIESLTSLASEIVGADFWPHGRIDVVAARSGAGSSSTRQQAGEQPVVRLAAPQMTPATLVHEFAHVLAGVGAGHGPTFRRAHVDLAGFTLGDEAAGWLIEAYTAMELTVGERAWQAPPLRPGRGGALAL